MPRLDQFMRFHVEEFNIIGIKTGALHGEQQSIMSGGAEGYGDAFTFEVGDGIYIGIIFDDERFIFAFDVVNPKNFIRQTF